MDEVGRVGRVRDLDRANNRIYFSLEEGGVGWFGVPPEDLEDWAIGDVVFITDTGFEKADPGLWVAGNGVGEVKLVSDHGVLITIEGSHRVYDQREAEPFKVGQMVVIGSNGEPGATLSEEPIEHLTITTRFDDFDVESLILDPEHNDTEMSHVGGSEAIKRRAENLVKVALQPEHRLSKIGVKPIKGILFSGPSGTGKTFLAKALASVTSAKFYNISGPVIAGELVGQSERRLRDIFDHAADNKPAILFFDEIDSLYTQRGSGSNEHTNRLVGQFLALLDGFRKFDRVMVIAATNLPGALDDALLRPGRLGHKLVFARPDESDRHQILQAQVNRLQIVPGDEPPLEGIVAKTAGWTAADLEAIWTEAGILAALDDRDQLNLEDIQAAIPLVQRVHRRSESGASHDQ